MFDQSGTKVASAISLAVILSSALLALPAPSSAMPTPHPHPPSRPRSVNTSPSANAREGIPGTESVEHLQNGSRNHSHVSTEPPEGRLVHRPAKFINPCRIPTVRADDGGRGRELQTQTLSDADHFHNIVTQSHKSLRQAQEFVNDFYKDSFGTDLRESGARDRYQDVSYSFLVNVTVSQPVVDVEEQLRSSYETLQRFAVALEAIVMDQARFDGDFLNYLTEAEYQLKFLLCELQIAMLEKNIEYEGTDAGTGTGGGVAVGRDLMASEHRDIEDKSSRDVRDYVILRDYIKTLEHVERTFQDFHDSVHSGKSVIWKAKTKIRKHKQNQYS